MSISVVRYIELLAVNKFNDKYFLHTIVCLDQPVELQMEVDAFTVHNLQAQCSFNKDYKYRLSLRALEDVFSNRIYSSVTKTFLTQSERFDFDTTPLYKRQIEQIKSCISIEQLVQLPFVIPPPEQLEQEEIHELPIVEVEPEIEPVIVEAKADEAPPFIEEKPTAIAESIEQPLEVAAVVEVQPAENEEAPTPAIEPVQEESAKSEPLEPITIIEHTTEQASTYEEPQAAHVASEEHTAKYHTSQAAVLEKLVVSQQTANEEQAVNEEIAINDLPQQTPTKKAVNDEKINPLKSPIILIATIFIVVAAVLAAIQLMPSNAEQAEQVPVAKTASHEQTTQEIYKVSEAYTFSLPPEYVALTFTKGPSPYTAEIVEILEQKQVGAAFFLIGKHVAQYPNEVKLIADKGFSIGHATENYTLLTTMPKEQQLFAWQAPAEKIEQLTGQSVSLFRPPYGLFNSDTQTIVEEHDFHIVNWTIDPYDVKAQVADDIVHYIEEQTLKGAIINLAESSATVEALPQILKLLQQQNLKVVMLQ